MEIFEQAVIGNLQLTNRLIRSATFEGMSDENGIQGDEYYKLYTSLSNGKPGAIITGVTYISPEGKVMHPGQAGLDSEEKIPYFKKMTENVHRNPVKIFIQLSHSGRQTRSSSTGFPVKGVSGKRSKYFNETPAVLSVDEIERIIEQFSESAFYSKQSGFDGIQLLASHGYLIHQFIHPFINDRKDIYGIDHGTGLGTLFLDRVMERIRDKCGNDYPILIKISGGDDYKKSFSKEMFIQLIKFLDSKKVSGIEISYGTMDYALNIFRCSRIPIDTILEFNPRYKITNRIFRGLWKLFVYPFASGSVIIFTPMYNLGYAELAKRFTDIPIISVGGFRTGIEIRDVLSGNHADFIGLCRPFIIEPDFAEKLRDNPYYRSLCINCSRCAIMVDTEHPTQCWEKKAEEKNEF
ncbi:MAG TPA: NADH:flavin oxidoreductase [Firmicutes bacterium]|nr:NADH:flavin oxidoreductase [Bacillota bacterium]